ncbi:MAG TPA: cytochrome c oxidase subunit 3 [Terriglobales bacterium]|nr:cytochrome c oxidase subunit 3 [Terriglobales bacterium]
MTPATDTDHPVVDVSGLPEFGFGSRGVVWWGVLGFISVELTMLVLCLAAYFYLRSQAVEWPPANTKPELWISSLNTGVLLASLVPMIWTERAALHMDVRRIRIGLMICLAFSAVFVVLRITELYLLPVRWNENAYGSILWTTIGLHTGHMFAEVIETVVILVLMFRKGPIHGKYFSDIEDNALYWYFIVGIWVPVFAVLFLSPRFL